MAWEGSLPAIYDTFLAKNLPYAMYALAHNYPLHGVQWVTTYTWSPNTPLSPKNLAQSINSYTVYIVVGTQFSPTDAENSAHDFQTYPLVDGSAGIA